MDWLVCVIGLAYVLCSPPIPVRYHWQRQLNGTASSGSNNLPASARPRAAWQKQHHLLRLHDPYGPGLSRKYGNWSQYILPLISQIFLWSQFGLPSVYFFRVASIIRKSEISMVDFASLQRYGVRQDFSEVISLAGGFSAPCIDNILSAPSVQRFKEKWEAFAMRCREEWTNSIVVCTLLLR